MRLLFDDLLLEIPGRAPVLVKGSLHEEERVVLRGPSGCGKTTLLRCIAGVTAPKMGRIRLDDEILTGQPPQKVGAGFVFQSGALFPHLSVVENIIFGLRFSEKTRHYSQDLMKKKAQEFLNRAKLKGFENRSVTTLSGGERQRVALMRTLITEPRVLLMDEPLSAVDAELRADLQSWIISLLKERPVPTLIVSHDAEEAKALGTRVMEWRRTDECIQL